jgi:hypothetical protein
VKDAPMLTSNDLALAMTGAQLAHSWWKKQPASKIRRERMAAFDGLIAKLNSACDHLNPYDYDSMPLDFGDDPIYAPMTKEQQQIAIAALEARMTPTETLVAELRDHAKNLEGWPPLPIGPTVTAALIRKTATTLATQSALIETLTRERDEARQQYVDANEAKIDAEVALADLRDMALEEAAARIEPKNERADWTQYAHFMHEAAESIRALKSA